MVVLSIVHEARLWLPWSLKKMPYRAIIKPAKCKKCGFVFHKDKLHKPGKCPMCHSTWISESLISIEE
jgi:predicted Zn-ribbon and HTH transcriptional regulator